jgi:small subunit ribosomal protein S4
MGDPKKMRPKVKAPRKIWDPERIRSESALKREYGLTKTRELWTALSELKRTRRTARKLLSLGEEGEMRGQKIITKLQRLGIGKNDMKLEDILALTVRDYLDRRLQTVVLKRGLARTMKQSRQLITHGFVSINGRRVTIPSYMVLVEEEQTVSYFKAIDIAPPQPKAKVGKRDAEPESQASAPVEHEAQNKVEENKDEPQENKDGKPEAKKEEKKE